MSFHVLKYDIPKHPRGTVVEIPDLEMSKLFKGEGYYIQIFRDSELLYPKYPTYAFGSDKNAGLGRTGYYKWKDIYRLIQLKDLPEGMEYGRYELIGDHSILGYVKAYADYDWLKKNNYNFISKLEEDLIQPGDLIVRIYEDGRRIKGIAQANREYININGDFNRFLSIETSPEHGIGMNSYALSKGNQFFYQKMTVDELTSLDETLIYNYIQLMNGTEHQLTIDKELMRIVKRDE